MRCAWHQWQALPQERRCTIVDAMRAGNMESVMVEIHAVRNNDIAVAEFHEFLKSCTRVLMK